VVLWRGLSADLGFYEPCLFSAFRNRPWPCSGLLPPGADQLLGIHREGRLAEPFASTDKQPSGWYLSPLQLLANGLHDGRVGEQLLVEGEQEARRGLIEIPQSITAPSEEDQ
jgi:hypothetical protein